jgi:hypothetical protein
LTFEDVTYEAVCAVVMVTEAETHEALRAVVADPTNDADNAF